MPMQNMHDLKDKVDLNLGILSVCETAIFMRSPEKAEERPHAAKQIIEALEEANKERTKQISTLQLQTIQDTNIEELAGCHSSFSPSDLFKALAAEAAALAANKVWNPKEQLATE